MRKTVVVFISATMLAITGIGCRNTSDHKNTPQMLFVLSAKSGSFEGDTLTLNDVPLVIYFSDRPDRIAGHESLRSFVNDWARGSNSFKADPPNATLSVFDEEGNKNAVIEINNPKLNNNTITFEVRLLEGSIPKSFEASSLFVDPLGALYVFVLNTGKQD